MAAAYAYRGHWKSLRDPAECEAIRKIEAEEWEQRRIVGGMLRELDAGPSWWRDAKAWLIGRTLGRSFRGRASPSRTGLKLEIDNVDAYEAAAVWPGPAAGSIFFRIWIG